MKSKMQEMVIINKEDLFSLLDYVVLLNEKKDYAESGYPKNHIWCVAKRLMKESKYKENHG